MPSEIGVRLTGDNSSFRNVLKDSERVAETTFKRLAKVGIQLGGFGLVASAFRDIVQHARNLTGPLDEGSQRAKNFALALAEMRKSYLDIGVKALGWINGLGDAMGRQLSIVKYGREHVELTEKIAKDTEQTVAALEKQSVITKAINAFKEQSAKLDRQISDERAKDLSLSQQRARAEQQYLDAVRNVANASDPVKRAEAQVKAKEAHVKLISAERAENKEASDAELKWLTKRQELEARIEEQRREGLDDAGKEKAIQGDIAKLTRERSRYAQGTNEFLETTVKLNDKNRELEEQRADAAERQAEAAKRIAEAAAKAAQEADARAKWAGNLDITGRPDDQLSEGELSIKIRSLTKAVNRRKIGARGRSALIGELGTPNFDPFLSIQQDDLSGALAESRLRSNARLFSKTFGEQRTMERFGISEGRLSDILRGTVESTSALNRIENLLRTGIQVQPLQGPGGPAIGFEPQTTGGFRRG